jgi:hypothetical protein
MAYLIINRKIQLKEFSSMIYIHYTLIYTYLQGQSLDCYLKSDQ